MIYKRIIKSSSVIIRTTGLEILTNFYDKSFRSEMNEKIFEEFQKYDLFSDIFNKDNIHKNIVDKYEQLLQNLYLSGIKFEKLALFTKLWELYDLEEFKDTIKKLLLKVLYIYYSLLIIMKIVIHLVKLHNIYQLYYQIIWMIKC